MAHDPLHPCASCARHVRASETTCPFCGKAPELAPVAARAPWPRRLTRAAIFVFGASAATAASVVGCSSDSDSTGTSDASTRDDVTAQPPYGHPPEDASFGDSGPRDAADEDTSLVAMYGGPPDAGDAGDGGG